MNILKQSFLFLIVTLFTSQSCFARTEPAAQQLSGLLSNLHEFTAEFKQNTYDAQHKLIQQSEGQLALLRPGNFRWETLAPMHQLLITNGKSLWIYDVDLEQVTQQQLDNQGELNPAQLLSGSLQSLESQFTLSQKNNTNTQVFKLVPKAKEAAVAWIQLQFENGQLKSMQFANELGEINDFQFSNIQKQSHLRSKEFNFKAPAGVDVLVNS